MSTEDAERPVAPKIHGAAPHVLVVRAPYYREVADGLLHGAQQILDEAGATHEVFDVAGSYELAQTIRLALRGNRRYDGFIALGCIVRGETDHYEFICKSSMDGLMNVALQFGIALGTGLLTCDTVAQAEARSRRDFSSGRGGANKGAEAAVAALVQINAARHFGAA